MRDHISSLQASILQILLDRDEPISANSIAEMLDSTASTIRYHLAYIKELVRKAGGTLSARPRVGFFLDISPDDAQQLRDKLRSKEFQFHYNYSDRVPLILFDLLVSTTPLTITGLASQIGISKVTLIKELDRSETWLEEHHLSLNRKTRTGIWIAGEEDHQRHALVTLLLEILPENDLVNICRWGLFYPSTDYICSRHVQNYVISHIKNWNLHDAWWLIQRISYRLAYHLSDNRYLVLLLYWAVMIQRVRQGFVLDLPDTILAAMQGSDECQAIVESVEELVRTRNLHIPAAELAHFSALLQTSPHGPYNQLGEVSNDTQDQEATQLANYFVQKVEGHTDFSMSDPVIFKRLCKHIGRTLTRVRYSLPVTKPFTDEITKKYPKMWKAVCEAVETGGEETQQFRQEEITYITMYFILAQELEKKAQPQKSRRVIVACPTGGISIWMLVSRFQKEFPDVEIVAAISLRELQQQDKSQADLIVTTAHHVVDKQLPVITVSPFLTEGEIELLKTHLNN
ncbi:MAG: PRD domain-containing protein [Anaerolineales bacterium]|nr:PRD domain-containing protein [Anaerolineales bacterium]